MVSSSGEAAAQSSGEDKLGGDAAKNTTPTDSGGKNTPRNKSPKNNKSTPRSPKSKSPSAGKKQAGQTAAATTAAPTTVKRGKSDQDDGTKKMFDIGSNFFKLN